MQKEPNLWRLFLIGSTFEYALRFICVCNSKVFLLLEVKVGSNKVQQVLRHQFGLQREKNNIILGPIMNAVTAYHVSLRIEI